MKYSDYVYAIFHCNLAVLLLKMSVSSALNLASIYLQEPSILKCERSREEKPHHEREKSINHPILIVTKKKMCVRQSLICIETNESVQERQREKYNLKC